MTSSAIAAIDVHKKVWMVVLVSIDGEQDRQRFATTRTELAELPGWLQQRMLSSVPEPEPRTWRHLTRGRMQLVPDRVRFQNQVEALLEEASIKLSGVIRDLFGLSGRRILEAMGKGQSDAQQLAPLGDRRRQCGQARLQEALRGRMTEPQRELLQLSLQRLTLLDQHIAKLEELAATVLEPHREAVLRLAQVPGLGVNAAQPIIAEVGAGPAAFASASRLASWAGICPGQNISAEVAHSTRSAKGNRHLWAVLVQTAQAAVKTKHTYRQRQFRRGYRALDSNQRSGRLLPACADWCGRSCTTACPTSNLGPSPTREPNSIWRAST